MNIPQFIPRIDCQRFARCGDKSLAHCRQYRGTAPDCAGCQLIKRKPKNRMFTEKGVELKLCTKCGRWLPLLRFYNQTFARGEKTYHRLSSNCKMCISKDNSKRQKSKNYEIIKRS